MNRRHYDDGTSIHAFTDRFLVRCPKCDSCAEVTRMNSDSSVHTWWARFCCSHCTFTRLGRPGGWSDREPFDWAFGYPLWLQIPCCGHVLWAYNFSHLRFIESYVEAEHRVGLSDEATERLEIRNSTLASTLPGWMISAKNRKHVLRAVRRLRENEVG